ncbi:peptidoglycan editing factor PgeF [Brevibacillus ginsengisoli]|uniref:peptidoglycan editing factor PgeF n=1 Tax=Brevibacillus ginsengisoli TaxID=363854 RepID=UPI003CF83C75
MEPFVHTDTTDALHLREWEELCPDLVVGFSLRTSGFSEAPYASCNLGLHVGDDPAKVIENRRSLANRLGFEFDAWSCADQVHGNQISQITKELRGRGRENHLEAIEGTDGIFTNETDILLTSFYADCVPLLFLDPDKRVIGLAHAGWKGTVGLIAEEMIKAFQHQFQTKPEHIRVAIGPSIGGCCYEVDENVMQHVRQMIPNWQSCVTASKGDRFMLDLRACNTRVLERLGVLTEHITRTSWCTNCRTDLFFSHRKEAGKTGRMASFIGWRKKGED